MAQQCVLSEAVEVKPSRWNSSLKTLKNRSALLPMGPDTHTHTKTMSISSPQFCSADPHMWHLGSSGEIQPQSCSCRSSPASEQKWQSTPHWGPLGCSRQRLWRKNKTSWISCAWTNLTRMKRVTSGNTYLW